MKKPALVVMAAGMGSRYGGLKQIDPVDKEGDIIIDFSIYDALQAGFEKIVFIKERKRGRFPCSHRRPHEQACRGSLCIPGSAQSSGRLSGSGRTCETMGHRSCDHELYRCDRRTICSYQCRRLLWTSCISDGL